MLGVGNAIVRVTATLDFSRAVADRKIIDPESATVVSEERIDQLFESDNVNSAVKNYELSETLERTEKSVGDIDFLTVSVILNYQRTFSEDEEGVENETFSPYPDNVVTEIESIVKNAVGFKADRGDGFAIQQIRFDTTHDRRLAQELEVIQQNEQLEHYIRYALMAIALILALWLMRAASRKANELALPGQALEGHQEGVPQLAEGQGRGQMARGPDGEQRMLEGWDENEEIPLNDIYASKLSAEARQRMKAREKLFEEIKKQSDDNPEVIISVLRSWMSDELALSFKEA
jgi:flagellar M-ring protein FliF